MMQMPTPVLLRMHACMLQIMFFGYFQQSKQGSCLSCHLHRLSSSIYSHACTDAPGVTPDPLDHSFAWQLLSVLQAVDAVALEDDNGCSPSQVSFLQRPVLNQQSETNLAYCILCEILCKWE